MLEQLRTRAVELWLDGARLRYRAPQGALDEPLRATLQARRDELLAALQAAASGAPGPRARGAESELSLPQARLWFLEQLTPDTALYNIPAAFRLCGRLDEGALGQALDDVVARHEVLRSSFHARDGHPRQRHEPSLHVPVEHADLTALPPESRAEAARERLAREVRRPFDLSRPPLLRACLLRLAADEHVFGLTVHHLLADGWSLGILLRDLGEAYAARVEARPARLAPLALQYADYALWQRERLSDVALHAQLEYWRERLGGALPPLSLPLDRPRPALRGPQGGEYVFSLPSARLDALGALARAEGCTPFVALLCAFALLLGRLAGQDDVRVASAWAGRNRAELEDLIGFFVNTLVLRVDLSGRPTFRALLRRARGVVLEAFAHHDVPFDQVVEALRPQRDLARHPLADVSFVLQNAPMSPLALPGLRAQALSADTRTAKFDLTFMAAEGRDGLDCIFEYAADLFEPATLARWAGYLDVLLAQAVARPDAPAHTLALVDERARRALLQSGAGPEVDLAPGRESLQRLFELRVVSQPQALAISEDGGIQLGYAELNARANRLAAHLRTLGVAREVRVALALERSADLVTAMLAVLKAGGAFVPLDVGHPTARLAAQLEDVGAALVLTRASAQACLPTTGPRRVLLDHDRELWAQHSPDDVVCQTHPEQVAYVIFTSGSTGRPKGVAVAQRSIVALIESSRPIWPVQAGLRHAVLTSPASDVSVHEALMPLSLGGSLHVVPDAVRTDGAALGAWLRARQVQATFLPPALLASLLAWAQREGAGCELRQIIIGTEPSDERRLQELCAALPGLRIVNGYGPTEVTVYCTAYEVPSAGLARARTPIGRALPNVRGYLLDAALEPLPPGILGELYFGGGAVARGYVGRPDLTAERFLPDPFAAEPGARMYRTGDLARLLPSGELLFEGRHDAQVKVRGHRVELAEIEAALLRHPSVREAAVALHAEASGEGQLVAVVVAADQARPDEAWSAQRVTRWEQVFEASYEPDDGLTDLAHDFRGWNDSASGEPIPLEEMRAWADGTAARVLALRPRRVLEIGCGTGLVALRVAPACERYVGSDFSRRATTRLAAAAARRGLAHLSLHVAAADELGFAGSERFDVVVLNSVVQYFPSADYLVRVLARVFDLLAPGGAVFLGDLRHLGLQDALAGWVELGRADEDMTLERLRQKVRARAAEDEELLLAPAFFAWLAAHETRLRSVELLPKRGRARNELTRFRYDAVLRSAPAPGASAPPGALLSWDAAPFGLATLRARLQAAPAALALRDVPDPRLDAALHLRALLHAREPAADDGVRGLRRRLAQPREAPGLECEDVCALGDEAGYDVHLRLSALRPGRYDAWLLRRELGAVPPPQPLGAAPARLDAQSASDPLQDRRARTLGPVLREHLRGLLPEVMVPAAFVFVEALPRTPAGKLDRGALPAPLRGGVQREYVPPSGELQAIIAGVFQEALGIAQVGARDNFFDLGGHSLLLAQVKAELDQALRRPVALLDLFAHPTVERLAAHLSGGARAAEAGLQAGVERARLRQGARPHRPRASQGELS